MGVVFYPEGGDRILTVRKPMPSLFSRARSERGRYPMCDVHALTILCG
jgi:hypothetical protein